MKHAIKPFCAILVLAALVLASAASADTGHVTITKKDVYYAVDLDLSSSDATRKEVGQEYGQAIKEAVPGVEGLMDSLIQDMCSSNSTKYQLFLYRTGLIRPNVPKDLQDDVDGMAQGLCSADEDIMGDGLLSPAEVWFLNLIPDVARTTQCSGFGILPQAAASGKCTVVRNLDWDDGATYQLSQIQAVLRIKISESRSVTMIGYLTEAMCISGFNNDGLFAAILDSGTGREYTAENKRSYAMDLRYALENENADTIAVLADILDPTATEYTYGHIFLLADRETAQVYEDDLQPDHPRLRAYNSSPLYHPWDVANAIGAVNCFMLTGNIDNAQSPYDVNRWDSMQNLLNACGPKITWADMEYVTGYGPGTGWNGYLYILDSDSGVQTQQSMVFEPESGKLSVAFHPVGRSLEPGEKPDFRTVNGGGSSSSGCAFNPRAGFSAEWLLLMLPVLVIAARKIRVK